MKTVKNWRFIKDHNHRIDIACEHGFQLHIFVLENDNGGEIITVEDPLERIPLFLRAGSIIPMARKGHKNTLSDDSRELLTMPFINQGKEKLLFLMMMAKVSII
ncbi:hypothetical protein BKG95_10045 [Rodentibacter pneumotropicus]|nr:hypothetical protein BKG95_10045 [Rodentibacter pneumotropicus]